MGQDANHAHKQDRQHKTMVAAQHMQTNARTWGKTRHKQESHIQVTAEKWARRAPKHR